uniref:Uncharacterized protein n=1 Tax=Populus alba TaxID=43335 RepID=A0A4U5P710_POPAL|nr:hypothetical protein D5086_0000221920 [Populus alba]
MARQVDRLTRIGMEGFALIENSYGWPGRSGRLPSTQVQQNHHHYHHHHHHHQYQDQQTLVYQGTQITTVRMPVIISNEVVQYYGNMVKKPVIPSNEAAQYQGGVVKEPVITSDGAAQ